LVVGVVRELLNLRVYLGFVALIQLQDAGVVQSLKVIVCSILSLAGSASVGPEAGFSAIGGGAAALFYKYILRSNKRADPVRYKYFILGGMAASFSGFLPAPLLGMLLGAWSLALMIGRVDAFHTLSYRSHASPAIYSMGAWTSADGIRIEPGTLPVAACDGCMPCWRRVLLIGCVMALKVD
jgi:H+/Cl- antiporter ClcA